MLWVSQVLEISFVRGSPLCTCIRRSKNKYRLEVKLFSFFLPLFAWKGTTIVWDTDRAAYMFDWLHERSGQSRALLKAPLSQACWKPSIWLFVASQVHEGGRVTEELARAWAMQARAHGRNTVTSRPIESLSPYVPHLSSSLSPSAVVWDGKTSSLVWTEEGWVLQKLCDFGNFSSFDWTKEGWSWRVP